MDKLPLQDEDDLVVEIDPIVETPGVPPPVEELEDFAQEPVEAPTLPDDLERQGAGDPASRDQSGQPELAGAGDDEISALRQRAAEADTRARQAEASAILVQGETDAQRAQIQLDSSKLALDTLEFRINAAREQLVRAREEGNAAAEVQIQSALDELRTLKSNIEAARSQIPNPELLRHQARQRAAQVAASARGVQVGPNVRVTHPLAQRWADANPWMTKREHTQAHEAVIATSATLVRDGWDPNSPGFYAELSKRIKTQFPRLEVKGLQAQRRAPSPGVRTPVAPARSAAATPTPNGAQKNPRRYKITQDDISAMRRMNLDPQNPTHRKYFAKSRLESAARAQV